MERVVLRRDKQNNTAALPSYEESIYINAYLETFGNVVIGLGEIHRVNKFQEKFYLQRSFSCRYRGSASDRPSVTKHRKLHNIIWYSFNNVKL